MMKAKIFKIILASIGLLLILFTIIVVRCLYYRHMTLDMYNELLLLNNDKQDLILEAAQYKENPEKYNFATYSGVIHYDITGLLSETENEYVKESLQDLETKIQEKLSEYIDSYEESRYKEPYEDFKLYIRYKFALEDLKPTLKG